MTVFNSGCIFKPQVSYSSNRVVGVEALIRWQHPEAGLGSHATCSFPWPAERQHYRHRQSWVLEQACQQVSQWHRDGFSDLRMAVNPVHRCKLPSQAELSKSGHPI